MLVNPRRVASRCQSTRPQVAKATSAPKCKIQLEPNMPWQDPTYCFMLREYVCPPIGALLFKARLFKVHLVPGKRYLLLGEKPTKGPDTHLWQPCGGCMLNLRPDLQSTCWGRCGLHSQTAGVCKHIFTSGSAMDASAHFIDIDAVGGPKVMGDPCLHTYITIYLYTYIPIYLYTYVPMYLCTYIPMYLCTYVPIYLYTCIPVYLYTCIPVYLYTFLSIYLYTNVPTCLCTYLPMYQYTSIPVYLHTCTHIHLSLTGEP